MEGGGVGRTEVCCAQRSRTSSRLSGCSAAPPAPDGALQQLAPPAVLGCDELRCKNPLEKKVTSDRVLRRQRPSCAQGRVAHQCLINPVCCKGSMG